MYEAKPKWFNVPGGLSYVSYAEGKLMGVNAAKDVYYADNYKNAQWKKVAGVFKQVYLAYGNWKDRTAVNHLMTRGGASKLNPDNVPTHFPFEGDNKNYIRGDTIINGLTTTNGDFSVTGADIKITNGRFCMKEICLSYDQFAKLARMLNMMEI